MPAPTESFAPARPLDEHNQRLISNVHPQDWQNPKPEGRYHMVVIGAGTAGLVTAIGAAGLGAKVALVERGLMGGDCLNSGCVPSKALIRAARAVASVRDAAEFGLATQRPVVDFGKVMERMRRLRAGISAHDSAKRFSEQGIDVYLGQAEFIGARTVRVAGTELEFAKACIATGTRASMPPIPGLKEADPLTNETVFTLTELPDRLAVIGSGPIGVELAQSFARFGSDVTLIEVEQGILPREDRDAAEIVTASMQRDGVKMLVGTSVKAVRQDSSESVLEVASGSGNGAVRADRILVAAGRSPNIEGLGLDAAGIESDPREGVLADDKLRTSNRHVYAAGDICSRYKFTHMADAMARIVIGNALFFGRSRASRLNVPWCTYSDPELAHVGLSEQAAAERGIAIDTYRTELSSVDRAVLDSQSEGFVKLHCNRGTDKLVGATIVAAQAGELISEVTTAMTAGLGMRSIAATIHPYPTQAEAIRKAADAYQRTRLTPGVRRLLRALLRLQA